MVTIQLFYVHFMKKAGKGRQVMISSLRLQKKDIVDWKGNDSMGNTKLKSMSDLLELFEDSLKPSDLIEARAISQVTGTIIRERKRLGLDQKEFAEKLGVSQSLVSRWENGNSNFTIKSLAEIATKLDMCLDIKIKRKIDIVQVDRFEMSNYVKKEDYVPMHNYYKGNGFVLNKFSSKNMIMSAK